MYSAIMALNTKPSAKVFTSNVLSDKFRITNGTRRGCPLSPLTFFFNDGAPGGDH